MSCTEWKEHLIGSLYGDQNPEEEERFSAHLSGCEPCKRELALLADARRLLGESHGAIPAAPRVVILASRPSRIPLLAIAASLAAIGLLAGLSIAWSWQAREAVLAQSSTALPARAAPDRDELERWFDERFALLEKRLGERIAREDSSPVVSPSERPMTKPEVEALLARAERKLDRGRAADLLYLLDEMAAIKARTGETQQAIRYLALASDPRISEQ
ncbi:MAG: anti-sigma factor family protein [Vicinamibacteria bacterium]